MVSTINGDANVPFYKELGNQGIKATDIPVVAFSVGEEELAGLDTKPLLGHLAAWNYFESIKTPANEAFIKEWHEFTKNPKRTTNDPMEAHYIGFNMWVKAVEKAKSTDPDKVIDALPGIKQANLTGGISEMLPNHHITKPVFIGEIRADGQFNVVWKIRRRPLVPGDAWSDYLEAPRTWCRLGDAQVRQLQQGDQEVRWVRVRDLGRIAGDTRKANPKEGGACRRPPSPCAGVDAVRCNSFLSALRALRSSILPCRLRACRPRPVRFEDAVGIFANDDFSRHRGRGRRDRGVSGNPLAYPIIDALQEEPADGRFRRPRRSISSSRTARSSTPRPVRPSTVFPTVRSTQVRLNNRLRRTCRGRARRA